MAVWKIMEKILEYKWFAVFFAVFLAIQIYQATFNSWDSFVYLLQGKWFCSEQIYFEWLRPPLPGVINCISGATGFSTIISSILASFTYLIATLLIFKKEKINQFIFTGFAFLFPSILILSNAGGDLFALSFLLIALTIENPMKKGLFFGLATLARYNFFLYLIILLPQIKPKKWLKFIIPIIILWIPWTLYNFFATGNPFFSIEESVFLNVQQKGILAEIEIFHIILIAFFLATLFLKKISNNAKNKFNQTGLLGTIQFLFSGIKETRFLNVTVPAQAINLAKAFEEKKFRKVIQTILVISVILSGFLVTQLNPNSLETPEGEYLHKCRVMSDQWIYFYEKGIIAEPLPGKESFENHLNEGTSLIIYNKNIDLTGIETEVIETGDYTILKSGKCAEQPGNYVLKIWRGNWNQ